MVNQIPWEYIVTPYLAGVCEDVVEDLSDLVCIAFNYWKANTACDRYIVLKRNQKDFLIVLWILILYWDHILSDTTRRPKQEHEVQTPML